VKKEVLERKVRGDVACSGFNWKGNFTVNFAHRQAEARQTIE